MRKTLACVMALLLITSNIVWAEWDEQRLDALKDTYIDQTTLADGDLIQYDSTFQRWENVTTAVAGGGTFLKLDASNDPITNDLDVQGDISATTSGSLVKAYYGTKYTGIFHDGTDGTIGTSGGDMRVTSPENVAVDLGDAGGTYKLLVRDSGVIEVASIDSNGVITTVETVSAEDYEVGDATCTITQAVGGDLAFTDAITGTKTLAQLSAGGGGVTDHSDLNELDYASAGHTGFEASLGNPGADDYVLSSKMDGTRSWVATTGSAVTSVFGRGGDVVAETNDYTWAQIDKTTSDLDDLTTKSHTSLTDIGSAPHTDIDAHISTNTVVHASATNLLHTTGAESKAGLLTFSDTAPKSATAPTADDDLTNKLYVDTFSQGLVAKNACQVATTGNTVLTNLQVIDGIMLVSGNRVLVKDQTDPIENGIYNAVDSGSWLRSTDYDADSEVKAGTFTYIITGNTAYNTQWVQYEIDPAIGVDPINFRQLPSPNAYTASNGVQLISTDFQVDLSDTNPSLEVSDGGLRAKVDGTTINRAAGGLEVGTITDSNISGAIATNHGGTGETTIGTANQVLGVDAAATGLEYKTIAGGSNVTVTHTPNNVEISASVSGVADYLYTNTTFHSHLSSSYTWTNMPVAETAIAIYKRANLTGAVQYRICVHQAVAGAANAKLNLQYSTNGSTWYDCDTAEAGALSVGAGTGLKTGSWADFVSGAKQDVRLRLIGYSGDGIIDPQWREIWIEFKYNASIASLVDSDTVDKEITIHSHPASNLVWTNMPAATAEFISAYARQRVDLSNCTHYRIYVNQSVAGYAGADLNLEFSNDGTTWVSANTVDGDGELDVGTGTGQKVSSWTSLKDACKTDGLIRLKGKAGNGTADPAWRQVKVQFREHTYGQGVGGSDKEILFNNGGAVDGFGSYDVTSDTVSFNSVYMSDVESFIVSGNVANFNSTTLGNGTDTDQTITTINNGGGVAAPILRYDADLWGFGYKTLEMYAPSDPVAFMVTSGDDTSTLGATSNSLSKNIYISLSNTTNGSDGDEWYIVKDASNSNQFEIGFYDFATAVGTINFKIETDGTITLQPASSNYLEIATITDPLGLFTGTFPSLTIQGTTADILFLTGSVYSYSADNYLVDDGDDKFGSGYFDIVSPTYDIALAGHEVDYTGRAIMFSRDLDVSGYGAGQSETNTSLETQVESKGVYKGSEDYSVTSVGILADARGYEDINAVGKVLTTTTIGASIEASQNSSAETSGTINATTYGVKITLDTARSLITGTNSSYGIYLGGDVRTTAGDVNYGIYDAVSATPWRLAGLNKQLQFYASDIYITAPEDNHLSLYADEVSIDVNSDYSMTVKANALGALGSIPTIAFKSTGFLGGDYWGGMYDGLAIIEKNQLPSVLLVNSDATATMWIEMQDDTAGVLQFKIDGGTAPEIRFDVPEAADVKMVFNADNAGEFDWMEDEQYFEFKDDILMSTTEALYLRDTAISVNSIDDGHLDLNADSSIDFNLNTNTNIYFSPVTNPDAMLVGTFPKLSSYANAGGDNIIYSDAPLFLENTRNSYYDWDGDGESMVNGGFFDRVSVTNDPVAVGTEAYVNVCMGAILSRSGTVNDYIADQLEYNASHFFAINNTATYSGGADNLTVDVGAFSTVNSNIVYNSVGNQLTRLVAGLLSSITIEDTETAGTLAEFVYGVNSEIDATAATATALVISGYHIGSLTAPVGATIYGIWDESGEDWTLDSTDQYIQFNDADTKIGSALDGKLSLYADDAIWMETPIVTGNSISFNTVTANTVHANTILLDYDGDIFWNGSSKKKLTLRPGLVPATTLAGGIPTEVFRGLNVGYSMPIWSTPANQYEQLEFRMRIPIRWDGTTDPQFGICVTLSAGEDAGDYFKFQLEWQTTNKGNVMGTTTSNCTSEQAVLAGRNEAYDTYFIFFTLDADDVNNPISVGEMLQGRLRRIDATDPDVSNEIIVWDWVSMWAVDKVYGDWSVEVNDT